jgi:hypothetical protein
MDPHSYGQLYALLLLQSVIEHRHSLHHGEPASYRPLCIVFMRLRIAKVDQQAIAQILGNVAVKALDDFSTGLLIGAHHLAVVFRIELTGEAGGIEQITEQHRELAAFGLSRLWHSGGRVRKGTRGV